MVLGEEDEDGYDISRLRRPDTVDTLGRYDPLQGKYGRRGNILYTNLIQ